MSCSVTSSSPPGGSCHRQRTNTSNTTSTQSHQHFGSGSCVNVAPLPQCPTTRRTNSGCSRATTGSSSPATCMCSASCNCACATATIDSKCPYMRRVAQARVAAANKKEGGADVNKCTALVPVTNASPSGTSTVSSARAALCSPSKSNSGCSSRSSIPPSSSAAPLVRGDEYSLYRLSKSAALQAASKGIQLTLVAPNSRFPSTPSSHSLHDHDKDTSSINTASTADNSTTTAAADGATARSATITTTITTRIRTYDGETGQSNGVVVSTTKRATIRSAL